MSNSNTTQGIMHIYTYQSSHIDDLYRETSDTSTGVCAVTFLMQGRRGCIQTERGWGLDRPDSRDGYEARGKSGAVSRG